MFIYQLPNAIIFEKNEAIYNYYLLHYYVNSNPTTYHISLYSSRSYL